MVRFEKEPQDTGGERSAAPVFPLPWVIETDVARFDSDVIRASHLGLVLADFWAPWCPPWRTLGPVLDKIALDRGGGLRIARINVDHHQTLAEQFQIRSIPGVLAFREGQPVEGFTGTLPEERLRAFIDRLMNAPSTEIGVMLTQAQDVLNQGDTVRALTLFREAEALDPGNLQVLAGVLRCQIALDGDFSVRDTLARLPPDVFQSPELAPIHALLDITANGGSAEHLRRALGRLSLDPEDHAARLEAARALFAKGDITSATDHLIASLKRNPTWNESMIRKQLAKIWDVLGASHPATIEGQRRLSALQPTVSGPPPQWTDDD